MNIQNCKSRSASRTIQTMKSVHKLSPEELNLAPDNLTQNLRSYKLVLINRSNSYFFFFEVIAFHVLKY
jgi:hypothetical protein